MHKENEIEQQATDMVELMPGVQEILLDAANEPSKGTWKYCFGNQDTADSSIALYVPSGANPEAIGYTTTLNWVLLTGPGN